MAMELVMWQVAVLTLAGGAAGGLLKALEDGRFNLPEMKQDDEYALGDANLVVQGAIYGLVYLLAREAGLLPLGLDNGLYTALFGSFVMGYVGLNVSKLAGKVRRS